MSSIAGTLIRGDTRPDVPDFVPIDVTAAQRRAIMGNLDNLPDLAQLGAETNEHLIAQHLGMLEQMGLRGLYDQNTRNLESMSRGELPADTENAVRRYAAEAGAASGTSGSQFDRFRSARNLGLTSLDLTQRALGSSAQWLQAATSRLPISDFSQMFVSPMQQVGVEQWNKTMQWNRDWLHNQIRALPNQYEEAAAGFFDTIEETGRNFLVGWAGQQAGGGGGGQGGGGGGQYGGGSSWG